MSNTEKIKPDRITKPIQLLASWLVGLVAVNGSFLTAATLIQAPSWERSGLVAAAILNVPLFLLALFMLQTKFRPELQEDEFYSQYLDSKSDKVVTVSRFERIETELSHILAKIDSMNRPMPELAQGEETVKPSTAEAGEAGVTLRVAVNDYLEDFQTIRSVLKEDGIPVKDLFGSRTAVGPPTRRAISLSSTLDFSAMVRILRLAHRMNMELYTYYDPEEEDEISENVLIGAYGFDSRTSYPIDQELMDLFDSDPEPIDLTYFETQNRRSRNS